jgi:hypothetical protein
MEYDVTERFRCVGPVLDVHIVMLLLPLLMTMMMNGDGMKKFASSGECQSERADGDREWHMLFGVKTRRFELLQATSGRRPVDCVV